MKNFLTLNVLDVSSDAIQTSSLGAVSEEILEKIQKVTQAIEAEKVLCKPVPPVTTDDDATVSMKEKEGVVETPKKSKKHKRDPLTASSTKEKKKKRVRTE